MSGAQATAVAVTFVWLGMVLGISFIETPLKFRAPGITIPIGLGIGRLVFAALNAVELVLAGTLILAVLLDRPSPTAVTAGAIGVGALLVQVAAIRPRLNKRTAAVLAGANVPRSRAHHAYVGLEVAKVLALGAAGVLMVS